MGWWPRGRRLNYCGGHNAGYFGLTGRQYRPHAYLRVTLDVPVLLYPSVAMIR